MPKQLNNKEINALITLLDDPDEGIFSSVKNKLLDMGEKVIPLLENAWETSFNPTLQTRIENIIHRIQFEKIQEALAIWKKGEKNDLWEGVMLIARYQYPDLKEEKLLKQIQLMRQDVWLELNEQLTALEKVKVINHIIFDVHRFSGNTENYNSPENSFLNSVIENKKGNPLSLGIVYLLIAHQLELPLYGINLPEHFVLAYIDESYDQTADPEDKILFYINPFSRGAVFSRREIDMFLKQLNIAPEKMYYTPCNNVDIVRRLIRNLISAYTKQGNTEKTDELEELIRILG
jgi:regulator of sirC expression with transglutaminase-like and TPR domain